MKITNEKLKVAAYCRVSTKSEMQKKSIETQIGAYKTLISGNAEWDFAGIYLDYGSFGCREFTETPVENNIKLCYDSKNNCENIPEKKSNWVHNI